MIALAVGPHEIGRLHEAPIGGPYFVVIIIKVATRRENANTVVGGKDTLNTRQSVIGNAVVARRILVIDYLFQKVALFRLEQLLTVYFDNA